MFIYKNKTWPHFIWDKELLIKLLTSVSHRQGRLIGQMESLGLTLQSEAMLQSMTLEILNSSEIEGEILDRNQVRSSIARKLGMDIAGLVPSDRNIDEVVRGCLMPHKNLKNHCQQTDYLVGILHCFHQVEVECKKLL